MRVDVAGRRVLLDGCDPTTAGRVQQLLTEGATVTVRADEPVPSALRDQADRGLITLVEVADRNAFDLVLTPDPEPPVAPSVGGVGEVILVGGGPGDPGLLTVAGLQAVREADVIVADRLAPLAVLDQIRTGAEVIDVGKIPRGPSTGQDRINELLIEHATAGRRVVRLKGGDSFVLGRGAEEALACAEHGIAVRVIPGVTSAIAGPALAGIPVTHRSLTQGFTVVSGHVGPHDPRSTLDWSALARLRGTLVVLMGVATLPDICRTLVAEGLPSSTPAATIADAGLPSMRTVRGTVADIAERARAEQILSPAVTVIGEVAGLNVV